jgi:antitoxin component HigA of HigAB toxin-antitoxin module
MQITRTVSEADYRQELSEMRQLAEFEPDRGTADSDRMDALALVVEAHDPDRRERDLEDAENR